MRRTYRIGKTPDLCKDDRTSKRTERPRTVRTTHDADGILVTAHTRRLNLSSKAPKTPHALTSMRCPYLHERRSGCAVPCGGVVAAAIVLGSHLHLLRSCARPPVARAVEGGELCWKGAVTCVERRGTRTSTMETMCRPPSLAMRIHTAHNSRERQQPHCSGSLVGQHKLFSGEHAIPVKVEHVEALLVLVERNVPVAI